MKKNVRVHIVSPAEHPHLLSSFIHSNTTLSMGESIAWSQGEKNSPLQSGHWCSSRATRTPENAASPWCGDTVAAAEEAVLGARANAKVFTGPSATEKTATPVVTGIN